MKVCWRMLLPLMLGVVLPAVAMQGWSYGEYGVLAFAQTGSEWSYTFAYGESMCIEGTADGCM
jgi:malonyl CoA-acyl carrier protein transacylase